MKRLMTLVIAISLLVVMKCSKSDDAAPAALIVGIWKQETKAGTGCLDSNNNFPAMPCSDCPTDTYGSDGSYAVSAAGGTIFTGTYKIGGNSVTHTVIVGGIERVHTAEFTVTSTTLTLTADEDIYGENCKSVVTYSRM